MNKSLLNPCCDLLCLPLVGCRTIARVTIFRFHTYMPVTPPPPPLLLLALSKQRTTGGENITIWREASFRHTDPFEKSWLRPCWSSCIVITILALFVCHPKRWSGFEHLPRTLCCVLGQDM